METTMQSLNDAERFKYVVEETIKETNRVLNVWEVSDRHNITYDNIMSLFRSFLAKFFKHKFGWMYYNSEISRCQPIPIIRNNMLIGMSLTDVKGYGIGPKFKEFIDGYDFIGFNKANPPKEFKPEEKPISHLVDYATLSNIKFS